MKLACSSKWKEITNNEIPIIYPGDYLCDSIQNPTPIDSRISIRYDNEYINFAVNLIQQDRYFKRSISFSGRYRTISDTQKFEIFNTNDSILISNISTINQPIISIKLLVLNY